MIPTIQNNPLQVSLDNQISILGKKSTANPGEIHSLILIVAWVGLANVGLIVIKFKQLKYMRYLHSIFMFCLAILTWMSGFLAIIEYGVQSKIGEFHTYLGISILIIISVQIIVGISTILAQGNPFVHPNTIYVFNWIHRIIGIVLYIFSQVQIGFITYNKKQIFYPTMATSSITFLAYIVLSSFQIKMSVFGLDRLKFAYMPKKSILFQEQEVQSLQKNSQLNQFQITQIKHYFKDYFIFADRIYDIHRVLSRHPGGYGLIKKIRGMEVDRYIFDVQLINFQCQQKKAYFSHFHSFRSFSLAGEPFGRIKSVPTYANLYEKNMVRMVKNESLIHTPHLRVVYLQKIQTIYSHDSFVYNGYSSRSQFGKYYALSIHNKVTRLYSVTNFLLPSNIKLMSQIIKKQYFLFKGIFEIDHKLQYETQRPDYDENGVIPLLIQKKDRSSVLTPQFLRHSGYIFKKKIRLSMAYGRGLSLDHKQVDYKKNKKKIVIYAGGTGLNPFLDLIDITFKQKLLKQGHCQKNWKFDKICENQRKIIDDFSFQINIIVRQIIYINKISLFQMNYLAQQSTCMKVCIYYPQGSKIKYDYINEAYYKRLDKIVTSTDVNKFFPKTLKQFHDISHVYICGPPRLCDQVEKTLIQNKIPQYKFTTL